VLSVLDYYNQTTNKQTNTHLRYLTKTPKVLNLTTAMSRLITKNDQDDFPLLVDDTEDNIYHDSYQVLGMELGGNHSISINNNSTSSSNDLLIDILSTSFQGPSEEHTEFLHGKRKPHHNEFQSKKREELEDLYSFSVGEDDDPMLDLFEDDDEHDDDSEDGNDRRLQYFNSSQDMEDEDMIMTPYSYRNDKDIHGGERLAPLLYDPFRTKQGEDVPHQRTVRFADDESQSRLFQDDPMMQEGSLVFMTNEEKLLDIFDQQGSSNTGTTNLFEDDPDEESSYIGSDFDDEEEESPERKILKGLIYNGATIGVVAGLAYVGKKVMSAFQNTEDVPEGGNGIDNVAGTDQAGADATHTSIKAGTRSLDNSQSTSNAGGNANPSNPNSSSKQ
jgi:hypothetical protein